jgi:uncharacterized protein (DUF433 family)
MMESPITIDREIKGGRPVFRGTRVPIDGLFEYLESGETVEKFIADFPSVSRNIAIEVLEYARVGASR